MKKLQVAIDGPAGAGKSTVARLTAERLGYLYVDTGAMYRALTYKALVMRLNLTDGDRLEELAEQTSIRLEQGQDGTRVFCDDLDLTEVIRLPQVSEKVSLVAQVPGVRRRMAELQRAMAAAGGVVMDGRDIGSNVLPQAECKIYLTASTAERAKRRFAEMQQAGFRGSLADVEAEIIRRDRMDSSREANPLVQVADAVLIDTTELTIPQVVERITAVCHGRE